MSIFQATFCVALQVSGSAGSSGATPAFGPRNCGQFSACTASPAVMMKPSEMKNDL